LGGVEQLNDGGFALFGGENQHGRGIAAAAQTAEKGETVHFGQHQVEHYKVVAAEAGHLVAGEPVGSAVDCEPGALAQRDGQIFRQPDLVFDDQHSHGKSISDISMIPGRLNEAEAASGVHVHALLS
jgi:hypothetical protein